MTKYSQVSRLEPLARFVPTLANLQKQEVEWAFVKCEKLHQKRAAVLLFLPRTEHLLARGDVPVRGCVRAASPLALRRLIRRTRTRHRDFVLRVLVPVRVVEVLVFDFRVFRMPVAQVVDAVAADVLFFWAF